MYVGAKGRVKDQLQKRMKNRCRLDALVCELDSLFTSGWRVTEDGAKLSGVCYQRGLAYLAEIRLCEGTLNFSPSEVMIVKSPRFHELCHG